MKGVTDDRSVRSYAPLTDEHLTRLAGLAAADDLKFRRAHPDWGKGFMAACLVQGGARHRVYGDRGIKDLDVYLFYATPPGKHGGQFPWVRGLASRRKDFGESELGRQLYTAEDRVNPRIAPFLPEWDNYTGRRVDLISRGIAPHEEGPRAAVRAWLERGARSTRSPGGKASSAWHLARVPVVCLHPDFGEVWWAGLDDDEAGIEKGAYGSP
jgi:hypothetical protein